VLKHEDLINRPEYWLETIQNEIFRQLSAYLDDHNMTQSQFAAQLGVSKGYLSQVMKGEFNYTLKKLIELSLAIGKVPEISFKPLSEIITIENKADASQATPPLNKVAEPIESYKKVGE